jgi:hypothetical protein
MRFAAPGCVAIRFAALVWMADLEAAECVFDPSPTLSGKLYGKTIDASVSVPDVGLRTVDLQGAVKAEFQSDARGVLEIDFSSLPNVEYEPVNQRARV